MAWIGSKKCVSGGVGICRVEGDVGVGEELG